MLRRSLEMLTLWPTMKKVLLCAVLTGVGLGIVRGTRAVTEGREPFVDLGRPVPAASPLPAVVDAAPDKLRFAVATMVSAEATFSTYSRLVQRICRDVGYRDAFIVRPSYTEVRRALERHEVDVAFVCTGTYLHSLAERRIKLLVQPEFEGDLQYRCAVIVPAHSPFNTLDDLHNATVAYTDPESYTGHVVLRSELLRRGVEPQAFFRKAVFTGSHDRSILAVALSVVDAAPVDSLILESDLRADPSLGERVRTVWLSEAFGPPPIVVPAGIDPAMEAALRDAFLALDKDTEGLEILSAIGIRRFVPPRPESYETAEAVYRLQRQGGL